MNPIIRRELLEVLRRRRAVALQICLAVACAVLVLVRWPTGDVVDLDGARSWGVLRVFGYGMLAAVVLLVPAFPATSLVREKVKGTLALLLNSPMRPWSIYLGKFGGVLGFTAVLLVMTLPAAAACNALGGTSSSGGVTKLYVVLGMAAVQFSTLALLVSSQSQSTDGALRWSYALVLTVSVAVLAPHVLLQGRTDFAAEAASWLRCISPVPSVMEVLGQRDAGSQGFASTGSTVARYLLLSTLVSICCALATIARLNHRLLDRSRSAGVMTEDRSRKGRAARRIFFLVDPQKRSGNTSLWVNPVLVKEFRTRRFGRSHWMLRMIALSAILSLGLSYVAASGALDWGVELIGGALVLLQVALLILFAPSLAAGLISAERESGTWQLLRMTPISPGAVLRAKLLSVAWPVLLLLCATLPGYVVLMTIKPTLIAQVQRVVVCLVLTAGFCILVSTAASSLFQTTAKATTASYLILMAICIGPLLIWLGRDAPFGHATVQTALTISPVATALQASETPGFTQYELVRANWLSVGSAGHVLDSLLNEIRWTLANWWIVGTTCVVLLVFLRLRVGQLCSPE
jgi:ABC-type transport system involved in multi-copper enzyme maturation permease subunit